VGMAQLLQERWTYPLYFDRYYWQVNLLLRQRKRSQFSYSEDFLTGVIAINNFRSCYIEGRPEVRLKKPITASFSLSSSKTWKGL
jgi:hypothetical protein